MLNPLVAYEGPVWAKPHGLKIPGEFHRAGVAGNSWQGKREAAWAVKLEKAGIQPAAGRGGTELGGVDRMNNFLQILPPVRIGPPP